LVAGALISGLGWSSGYAQPVTLTGLTSEESTLLDEHVYLGLPTREPILIRRGYVALYNPYRRDPVWVSYHVVPEYRDTPPRQGRFASFRTDFHVPDPVRDEDYVGLMESRGYARGHLAPYAVMGGDRDNDGRLAQDDPDDAEIIFQANYMSNITPQHQTGFNGPGGIWYTLERWVQDSLVIGSSEEVWVQAGAIFGPGANEKVGPASDIHVPPMFYKIVAWEAPSQDDPMILAFLFPHQRVSHGEIQDFLVTINVLEAMTGLDFFPDLEDDTEATLEDRDTWETWTLLTTP
jgi:endonuclease G